jgi:hypothetical protein
MKYINKIEEAFQAGKAEKLIGKLINVMRRTIKKPILYTTIEKDYMNTEGKFKGFLSYIPTMKLFFRINFKLTSSDEIVSLDFYNDMIQFKKGYPSFTVDTTGLNIVQIIDVFEDNIEDIKNGNVTFDDDFARDIAFGESVEKITEKGIMDRQQQLFNMWVEEDKEALKKLSTQRMADVYADFLGADSYNAEIKNLPTFVKFAKQLLFSKGMTNPTFRLRKKNGGGKERPIIDQAKSDQFDDMISEMTWEDKFEMLNNSVESVVDGNIQALIVSGSPGSGKSEAVYSKLSELGVDYKLFSGGLSNSQELFNILVKYSAGEIIVFDDMDAIFKDINTINILKAALQNKQSREITWRDKKLTFTSGIIMITNLEKLNSALVSRAFVVRVDLTNEQMVDKIEKTMEGFHPEIDMNIKMEVISFLKEISSGVRSIDYRNFEKALLSYNMFGKQKYKKFAIFLIKNED